MLIFWINKLLSKIKNMLNRGNIQINGRSVKIYGEFWQEVVKTKMFTDWIRSLDREIVVKKIIIPSVDFAGDRVLFVKMNVKAFDGGGSKLSGIVFLRGGSVAILMVLNCMGEKYTVITKQTRLPIGKLNFREIPAGMMDGEGNFGGVAAREIEEEVGVKINQRDLVDMTSKVYGEDCSGIIMSVGACDEYMRFFCYELNVDKVMLSDLQGKLTGLRQEGEKITLEVIKLDQLITYTTDAKALCAHNLYQQLTK